MNRKPGFAADHEAHAARLAWWASFVATIGLIAILGMARSAQALPLPIPSIPASPGSPATPVVIGEDEEECETDAECEEELEGEECEEAEDEAGECEEAAGVEAPAECRLSSASATVSTDPAHGKIRLLIHYATFSPTSVSVGYFLRGGKGPLAIGVGKVRFAKHGSLHRTETLTAPQLAKVAAARDFTVQLRPAGAPSYCHHLLDRHLTVRRAAGDGFTWSDPEAGFRPSRRS